MSHRRNRGTPAARGFRLATDDPAELATFAGSISDGSVKVGTLRRDFSAALEGTRLAQTALFCASIRNGRLVSPPFGRDFLSLTIPLEGGSEIVNGRRPETLSPGSAHILAPDERFDFRVPGSGRMLVANFMRRDLVGRFDGPRTVDLRDPRFEAFSRFLRFVWNEVRGDNGLTASSFPVQHLEECLTEMVRDLLEGSGSDHPREGGRSARRVVRRATEFMLAHAGSSLTLSDVTDAVGVSTSTLVRAFRSVHGSSPMQFLRRRRLDMARDRLLRAVPGEATVTDVARDCGFEHLGRFAVDYRAAFGESPSTTLKS
jgi:AraC-like DNA-binding protein